MVDQPATCASCGKRLSKKQWYYRNNQFFCKKRCWETAKEKAKDTKAQADSAKAEKEAKAKAEKEPGAPAKDAPAKPAESPSSAA